MSFPVSLFRANKPESAATGYLEFQAASIWISCSDSCDCGGNIFINSNISSVPPPLLEMTGTSRTFAINSDSLRNTQRSNTIISD